LHRNVENRPRDEAGLNVVTLSMARFKATCSFCVSQSPAPQARTEAAPQRRESALRSP